MKKRKWGILFVHLQHFYIVWRFRIYVLLSGVQLYSSLWRLDVVLQASSSTQIIVLPI